MNPAIALLLSIGGPFLAGTVLYLILDGFLNPFPALIFAIIVVLPAGFFCCLLLLKFNVITSIVLGIGTAVPPAIFNGTLYMFYHC
jgi:hypothetical protein